jgi:hypothetical protein
MEARHKMVSMDIANARMWNIMDWTLWRGRPPPKWLKSESHVYRKRSRRRGNSGHWERKKEREVRKVDDCVTSGSATTLTVSCSGRASLRRERE